MTTDTSTNSTDRTGERPDPIDARGADPSDAPKPAGPDALAAVFKQLAEAVEYLAYLLATQVDRVKLKIRNLVMLVALGVIAGVAALAFVFCTIWLLLSGIAGGLGELLGDRPWLGGIIISAVILIVGGLAGWIVYRRFKSSGLKSTRRRYEERQAKQRARFGREVEQAAGNEVGSKQ
jgi:Putative Actinobacterial Holin-X, holin superfamily III